MTKRCARVAASFLPLYGPMPGDATFSMRETDYLYRHPGSRISLSYGAP
jgi:hypothetical protein